MLKNLVGNDRELDRKARGRFAVIFVSGLLIFGGFSILAFINVSADDPVPQGNTTVVPPQVTIPQTFYAEANFTHAGTDPTIHNISYSSGRIYMSAVPGIGCTGTYDSATVSMSPQPGRWIVNVTNYNPYGPPFNLGGGNYMIYFYVADELGYSACHDRPGMIRIIAPDATPPLVAGHGLGGPPGFTGEPHFTINPATDWTELEYQINDMITGNSFITDAEYFYCKETTPGVPCGPDPWVNDTGFKPYEPLPPDPWAPFPPPQQTWDSKPRMFLNNTIDVSGWSWGRYWFYIHGADCGEDKICQRGQGDDNWGKNVGSVGNYFYRLSLDVGEPMNPPLLEWTGEPGYETDGVNPDSGPAGTNFTYKVKYSDADNDTMPTDDLMRLWIHKPCGTLIAGNPYIMSFERWVNQPNNYTQGAVYNITVQLNQGSSLYAYNFSSMDATGMPAIGEPTVACTDGPDVIAPNIAPVLSWTGQPGYTSDGVEPNSGTTTTLFDFRVNYTDADNDPPQAGYPEIYLEKPCGTPFSGPFTMTAINGGDNTYTDGKLYTYTTTFATTGTYGYRFNATDGSDWATGTPTTCQPGPTVTPGTPPPSPPPNLRVERSNPNIVVRWGAVSGADSYHVYWTTNNRFATFPSGWTAEPPVLGTSWTHTGAYGGTNTYYYIVRAYTASGGESTNSTMGVKLYKSFGTPYSPTRNLYWMSLPYKSYYKTAKDITDELTSTKITSVCKWNPQKQNSICYTYWGGRWRGTNFNIAAGDGISVNSVSTWTWVINGTDFSKQFNFIQNPKGNINWISLPYTNAYVRASDIVRDIEGPSMGSTKIKTVAMWDPVTQAVMKYYWSGSAWIGTNFDIMPGEGYYLEIIISFNWTPDLITPSVPP